ncbi:sugar transferase [Polaribacter uvawellassae]|uniref:sugar transferase n=1 Tax=Polaribacter uvawellassae TaxID=3133495 RepID=UPI00321989D8
MKRLFDVFFSTIGILFLSPFFLIISFLIRFNSKGFPIYKQSRVGRDNKDFKIFKFRTMQVDSHKKGLLTIGDRDSRITSIGYYLRKYKLDELPQLFNVFKGDMSFVGPRPEVRKYVDLYSKVQMKTLSVRPGITSLASIEFINENKILSEHKNPNQFYIDYIMPKKLEINLKYITQSNLLKDMGIILKTFKEIYK